MIPGYAGSEILRRFDAARGGFDGQAWNRNGGAGASWICFQKLIMNQRSFGGVRREGSRLRGDYGDLLFLHRKLSELKVHSI